MTAALACPAALTSLGYHPAIAMEAGTAKTRRGLVRSTTARAARHRRKGFSMTSETNPGTVDNQDAQSVTQEDKEWADKVIAVEHPNNHEAYEYAVAEVIAAHRLASQPTSAEDAVAWRYERNGVVALHSCRKPLYLTTGMGEWTETPLYARPLSEQPQEGDAAAEIASLKQRLESAEGLLTQWRTWACGQEGASPFQDTRAFLQEQEKQNG